MVVAITAVIAAARIIRESIVNAAVIIPITGTGENGTPSHNVSGSRTIS
jgi:hypothetical protein